MDRQIAIFIASDGMTGSSCMEVVTHRLDLKPLFETPNIDKAAVTLTSWVGKLSGHDIFHHLERQCIVEPVKHFDLG